MKENFEKKCDNKDCLNINMDKNLPDNHFFFQVSVNISDKRQKYLWNIGDHD